MRPIDPSPRSLMGRLFGQGTRRAEQSTRRPPEAITTRTPQPGPSRIYAVRYDAEHYAEDGLEPAATLPDRPPSGAVLWVHVEGLDDTGVVERLGRHFRIHPLATEDILHGGQRPKLEEYEDHLFLVLPLFQIGEADHVEVDNLSLVLGEGLLVSFGAHPSVLLDSIRTRLRNGRGRLRSRPADFLAYTILDMVVDAAFHVLEGLGERMERLEEQAMERMAVDTIQRAHELKRELLILRRSVWPLRDLVGSFLRTGPPFMQESTHPYLRDVHDHAHQLLDTVEILREMATSIQDLILSSMSHRMNEVMKVLTVMASIFIPLTFIAGVYGMNFEYMPELSVSWAYPAVLGIMGGLAAAMLLVFRIRRWI